MSKLLILFSSNSGNTRFMARQAADAARSHTISPFAETQLVELTTPAQRAKFVVTAAPVFAEASAVLVMFPVHAGRPPASFRAAVAALGELWTKKPVAVCVSHAGGPGPAGPRVAHVLARCGAVPIAIIDAKTPSNFPPFNKAARRPIFGQLDLDAFMSKVAEIVPLLHTTNPVPCKIPGVFRHRTTGMVSDYMLRSGFGSTRVVVDTAACIRCARCVNACPTGCLTMQGEGDSRVVVQDFSHCSGCFSCFNLCPTNAISMRAAKGKDQYQFKKEIISPGTSTWAPLEAQ
jgi:NAD-dependent dihydropyrimidine dehydrogenase PreA subunit/NAD(P)H-dependent FMN reductase